MNILLVNINISSYAIYFVTDDSRTLYNLALFENNF